jgi:hypothetical protein
VREAARRVAWQADEIQQFVDARVNASGLFRKPEVADGLGQDVAHAHARIEARVGILEHHLHLAAEWPQCAGRKIVDALAIDDDLPARDVEQAQDRAPDSGFAAAGFADQRERLAALDLKRYAIDRIDEAAGASEQSALQRVMLLEVVDFQEAHAATASLGA